MSSKMEQFVMEIKIENRTGHIMKCLGTAFYDGEGAMKTAPGDIAAQSTGNGGTLEKVGGDNGLFGLVAYSCADPDQMLVIYITMPATSHTVNHCYVALVPSGTPVDDKLVTNAYNSNLKKTEGVLNNSFTAGGKSSSMQVLPKVNDTHAHDTFSRVEINLSGSFTML